MTHRRAIDESAGTKKIWLGLFPSAEERLRVYFGCSKFFSTLVEAVLLLDEVSMKSPLPTPKRQDDSHLRITLPNDREIDEIHWPGRPLRGVGR